MKNTLVTTADRELAFQAARRRLAQAQHTHRQTRPHRAINHVTPSWGLGAQMLALPVLLFSALYLGQDLLYAFWRADLLAWAGWLQLPLRAATALEPSEALGLVWQPGPQDGGLSSAQGSALGAALVLLALVGSHFLRGPRLPLQYLVRIVCAVQLMALLYFWWAPQPYPHSLLNHVSDVLNAGYALLLAMPILLGLGYYALHLSVWRKLLHSLLMLAFVVLMVPQQALVHLLLLHHGSLVFMPVLYICFGALFDMMVFVALYAWAASTAPSTATL